MDIRLIDKIDVQIRLDDGSPKILVLHQSTEWTVDQVLGLVEYARSFADEPLPRIVRVNDPVSCSLMICR
jgi:hypothetical protein